MHSFATGSWRKLCDSAIHMIEMSSGSVQRISTVVLEDLLEERAPTALFFMQIEMVKNHDAVMICTDPNLVFSTSPLATSLSGSCLRGACAALSNGFDRGPCCCYTWLDAQTTRLHPRGCGPRAASLRASRRFRRSLQVVVDPAPP